MRRIIRYRPSPAIAVAVLAPFVAVSGIAIASIPGGGAVISACYQKNGGGLRVIDTAKHGHAGKCGKSEKGLAWNQQGVQGIHGRQGMQGVKGDPGMQGVKGDPGPSNAFGLSKDTLTVCGTSGCNSSMTLVDLPAGAYAIFAKVRADSSSSTGAYSFLAQCTLSAETDTDHASVELTDNAGTPVSARVAMMPLQLLHTFGTTGSATLLCINSDVQYFDAKITAIKLAQVSNVIAP
jgi:hypothetical protein